MFLNHNKRFNLLVENLQISFGSRTRRRRSFDGALNVGRQFERQAQQLERRSVPPKFRP